MNTAVGNYIKVYDDILTKEECNYIISEYKNSTEWRAGTIGNNIQDKFFRNCHAIGISMKEIIDTNYETRKKIDDLVCKNAGRSLHKYIEDFPHNNTLQYINSDSGYELLRYNEGGFYNQHTDGGNKARTLSLSFSLNDDYTGGEFAFFDREIKIKTKPGSVILFPSNFMYPHEILPVTKGTRYSIITWFN